jgi:hypothetical protein
MTLQHKYKHEHEAFGVKVQINSLCLIICTYCRLHVSYTLTAALHRTCSTCTTATNKKKTGNPHTLLLIVPSPEVIRLKNKINSPPQQKLVGVNTDIHSSLKISCSNIHIWNNTACWTFMIPFTFSRRQWLAEQCPNKWQPGVHNIHKICNLSRWEMKQLIHYIPILEASHLNFSWTITYSWAFCSFPQ